jgi:hypothetical protein
MEDAKMKLSHKFYWGITLICAYIFMLNFIPYLQDMGQQSSELNFIPTTEGDGATLGNSVSFFIERPRAYGTILQDSSETKLQLLNTIPIPIKRNGFNFFLLHIPFLGCFCFIFLKGGFKKDEQNIVSSHPNSIPSWNWANDFDANEYKSTSYCIWD